VGCAVCVASRTCSRIRAAVTPPPPNSTPPSVGITILTIIVRSFSGTQVLERFVETGIASGNKESSPSVEGSLAGGGGALGSVGSFFGTWRAPGLVEGLADGDVDGAAGADGAVDGASGADGAVDGAVGADGAADGAAGADGAVDGAGGADGAVDGVVDGVAAGACGESGSSVICGGGGTGVTR